MAAAAVPVEVARVTVVVVDTAELVVLATGMGMGFGGSVTDCTLPRVSVTATCVNKLNLLMHKCPSPNTTIITSVVLFSNINLNHKHENQINWKESHLRFCDGRLHYSPSVMNNVLTARLCNS